MVNIYGTNLPFRYIFWFTEQQNNNKKKTKKKNINTITTTTTTKYKKKTTKHNTLTEYNEIVSSVLFFPANS
jgi:hypothetical protein